MKKILSGITILAVATAISCNKPEAVLFEDHSTALKADKTGWIATANSEAADGVENTGKASALLDGNVATYWHTDNSVSSAPGYPHWVLIDMKSEKKMITVELTNRQASSPNKNGIKKFRLEASKDGTSFTSLGEFNFAITNNAQRYPVSASQSWRYLKLTALEGQNSTIKYTFLAEINVFTTR